MRLPVGPRPTSQRVNPLFSRVQFSGLTYQEEEKSIGEEQREGERREGNGG